MYKALFLVLAAKSELERYNRGQSAHDHFHGKYILAELGSPAFFICFTRMFI